MEQSVRYFVIKSDSFATLKDALQNNWWKFPLRKDKNSIQPHQVVSQCLDSGEQIKVIIGVSGSGKWQAFGTFLSVDKEGDTQSRFSPLIKVHWDLKYTSIFPNAEPVEGLEFEKTKDFTNTQQVPLSQCRNFSELDPAVGEKLYALMKEDIKFKAEQEDKEALRISMQREEAKRKAMEIFTAHKRGDEIHRAEDIWKEMKKEIETRGKLEFGGQLGSRNYNLSIAETSDIDFIFIYSAHTESLLCNFVPLKQTLKNVDDQPDFTLHEMSYFIRLLFEGDAKMIELLFHDPRTSVFVSDEFKLLMSKRELFLSKVVVKKYLDEVNGPKGFKLVQALHNHNESDASINKKFYILLRLLYHAKKIAKREELKLWFEDESDERQFFMDIRRGKYSYQQLEEMYKNNEAEVKQLLQTSSLPDSCQVPVTFLDEMLLDIRYANFLQYPTEDSSHIQLLDVNTYPWSSSIPGDVIFLSNPTQQNLLGVYIVHSSKLLSFSGQVENSITVENKHNIVELGKLCMNILSGNPNSIAILFMNSLFEIPHWKDLKAMRDQFLTARVAHQSMGFVKNEIRYAQKKAFNVEKTTPVLLVLSECLAIAKKEERGAVSFEKLSEMKPEEALSFAKELLEQSQQLKLDQSQSELVPPDPKSDDLKSWVIRMRKLFLKKRH